MDRNNLLFYLISIVVFLKIISIPLVLNNAEPTYSVPDFPIYAITVAMFVILWATFKRKLIRYSISFLFASYSLEYLARMMNKGSNEQLILKIMALFLLPLSFYYALINKLSKPEGNADESSAKFFFG